MKRYLVMFAMPLFLVGCQSTPRTTEPASGTLPFGQKVLVDDGSCPSGQIKQVTGGNGSNIPRARKCIPFPG